MRKPGVAFAYYKKLRPAERRIVRRSDKITSVDVPDPAAAAPWLALLAAGLDEDSVRATQKASHRLVRVLTQQLAAPPVTVRVLARRPHDEYAELHGLYEAEEGQRAVIRAWMRTAVHQRPVAFRSFVRTLLHELCHHLDFTVYGLDESFHTEGFFKREASLARQLLGTRPKKPEQLSLV